MFKHRGVFDGGVWDASPVCRHEQDIFNAEGASEQEFQHQRLLQCDCCARDECRTWNLKQSESTDCFYSWGSVCDWKVAVWLKLTWHVSLSSWCSDIEWRYSQGQQTCSDMSACCAFNYALRINLQDCCSAGRGSQINTTDRWRDLWGVRWPEPINVLVHLTNQHFIRKKSLSLQPHLSVSPSGHFRFSSLSETSFHLLSLDGLQPNSAALWQQLLMTDRVFLLPAALTNNTRQQLTEAEVLGGWSAAIGQLSHMQKLGSLYSELQKQLCSSALL